MPPFVNCESAHGFWSKLLGALNYPMVFRDNTLILLVALLISHLFKKEKEVIWNCFVKTFFWLIWFERDWRIFDVKAMDFSFFFLTSHIHNFLLV